jgi:hypothetical protein
LLEHITEPTNETNGNANLTTDHETLYQQNQMSQYTNKRTLSEDERERSLLETIGDGKEHYDASPDTRKTDALENARQGKICTIYDNIRILLL